jgi:hypothetical protein
MDIDAQNKYLNTDFAKAIMFYDDRAKSAKRIYSCLSIYVITVSALLTPLVAFAPSDSSWRIFITLFSATIVIAAGLLSHLKSHENWLSYRASWDLLQRERRLYETHSGRYDLSSDPDKLFVEQVESILAKEGADFYSRYAKTDEKTKGSTQNK